MKISLFLNDKIVSYKLPVEVSGSFSFTDGKSNNTLINVEARNGKWFLYSTSTVQVYDNNVMLSDIELVAQKCYLLKRNDQLFLIYVSSSSLTGVSVFNYDSNTKLIVGNDKNCNIIYNCPYLSNSIFTITCTDNQIFLEKNSTVNVYINKKAVIEEKITIKISDEIEIFGLKILFLSKYIVINKLNNLNIDLASAKITECSFFPDEVPQNLEIKDIDLYNKNDYASKAPRIRRNIEPTTIKISPPPNDNVDNELPLILVLGPMFTFGLVSVVMVFNCITRIRSGQATFFDTMPQLVMSFAMLLSSVFWPFITRIFNSKIKRRKRKAIIKKYRKYLDGKRAELEEISKTQKIIMTENLLSVDDCLNNIKSRNINFWSKRSDQNDFLVARVGIGSEPMVIDIKWVDEEFSIEDNALKEEAEQVIKKYKYIENVPLGYSFYENWITAIMGNKNKVLNFINNVLLQFMSFYSYEDLKIVVFTNNESNWDYLKYLNHSFSDDKSIRFFGNDNESCKRVIEYLNVEINKRINDDNIKCKPYYFIIVDDYDMIRHYDFIDKLTESTKNLGFSLLIAENMLSRLPSRCDNFINLIDGTSGILKNSYEKQEQISFNDEIVYDLDMKKVAQIVANIPVEFEQGANILPNTLSFLEMENVGKIEQLNILNRWNTNDSISSLKCEIGVDEQGNILLLDLHEKAHGPHGLIAGMTGSGKSEFIITLILSMSINYSPDDVSFIIIDYKGGGVAFAFEDKKSGMVLPHLAGTITNLDKSEMNRTLVSINSEINRRQDIFNTARNLVGESTIDIYKYQRYYKEGKLKEPVPHLFIICDEFAELKNQQPEFMDNLISVARIGRSLGIHLILATQKPSGIVNDQIWSNARFRVCLKVQDEQDSREVLKKSDAAFLKQIGSFYLQVGNDELYIKGQSAWSGANYYPTDDVYKKYDKNVDFINISGDVIKSVQIDDANAVKSIGDQFSNILRSIVSVASLNGKKAKKLWLDNIPSEIFVSNLETKYSVSLAKPYIFSVIGEYDEPENQKQGLVKYDFLRDGNTIIYGIDGTEREKLLNTIIYSSVKDYDVNEINYYIIDYGSEAFRTISDIPHIGGVVFYGEDEKFNKLLKMIKEEIVFRKRLFADYGGEYLNYIKSGNSIPLKVIIMNNYDSIYENNKKLYDELPELVRDSVRYGIIFIITANSSGSIHSRVSQNFENIYALKLSEDIEYSSIFSLRNKMSLSDIYGRGFVRIDGIHEFQVASICSDDNYSLFLKKFVNYLRDKYKEKAKPIPTLPERVKPSDVLSNNVTLDSIPIGIKRDNLEICNYNFLVNTGTLVSSSKLGECLSFCKSLCKIISTINNCELIIFDVEGHINDELNIKSYFNKDIPICFDKTISYLEHLIETKSINQKVIIIYGLDKFASLINDKSKMEKFIDVVKKYQKISIIGFDIDSMLKKYTYDIWFTGCFNFNNGIWIGKGIGNQAIFRLNGTLFDVNNEYINDMGFYIDGGYPDLVKLINFFDDGDIDGE